jgi:hypothetical protein
MKTVIALALLFALVPSDPPRAEGPVPLETTWLPGLGRASVSAEGRRLELAIGEGASARAFSLPLDDLPADARIRSAKAGPWMGEAGLAVVLAVESGPSTEYRFLLSGQVEGASARPSSESLRTGAQGWFLAKPLFASTGEAYRIVDVHNPHGGDALEITFRRGWPDLRSPEPRLDEKVFFDSCGGYWPEPLMAGRAELRDVIGLR